MEFELNLDGLDSKDRKRFDALLKQLRRGELPDLPAINLEQVDPASLGVPESWRPIVRYLRTAPFRDVPGVVGVGLGYRSISGKTTEEPAAVVLVRQKLPRRNVPSKCLLPSEVRHDGVRIRIDVQTGFDPIPRFTAAPAMGAFPRATHNCSGAALSVRGGGRSPCAGGSLTAHIGSKAFTCAHVALGFGFEDFIGNLPLSILWLFENPSGSEMIASSLLQVGQGLYQLFEVDTGWPTLVPLPLPLPGALAMLFVDGAAGTVNPVTVPPFLPPGVGGNPVGPPFSFAGTVPPLAPERSTRFGGRIRSARIAIPNERCHKDGQTTGLTFGRVWLPFFELYLPITLGLINVVVLFDTVLCDLVIAPGDSGAAILSEGLNYLAQVSIGLPPPAGGVGGGAQPGITCPVDSNDLIAFSLGTPYYWHELLLGVNLS